MLILDESTVSIAIKKRKKKIRKQKSFFFFEALFKSKWHIQITYIVTYTHIRQTLS